MKLICANVPQTSLINKEINKLTIKKINDLQGTEIRTIQTYFINNNEMCRITILFILNDLRNNLSLQYNLTDSQIEQIPDLLDVEEFRPLTIEDVALCCSRIKSGFYGKFNRMDLPEFFSILRKYQDEKIGIIADTYENKGSDYRPPELYESDEEFKKKNQIKLKEAIEHLKKNKDGK